MVNEAPGAAEQAQRKRDLLREVQGLSREDEAEIIFKETSPRRRRVRIYSMRDGEPVDIPQYMLDAVLKKPLGTGFMFTARQNEAPEYRRGTIKCFLHAESPDRPILEEIGLAGITCPANHLSSLHSKRMHGLHRHKEEWDAYQSHLDGKKEADAREMTQRQLDAMVALGQKAAGRTEKERAAPA